MRRIACVYLPEVRLEIVGEGAADRGSKAGPLAVVIARPGGAVRTERDVLGNTRLDVVSSTGKKAGIRPGQTVAAARAKHAGLRVRVVAESSVQTALARVAETALAFGPAVAFDVAHDVVWVDVTGCAHLHGGETPLAQALGVRVGALGHACRVAVAGGPRIAAAVARFMPSRDPGGGPFVVPEGAEAAAMRPLPVAALDLDEGVTTWLRELGLTRCGALQRLPRRSLGTRLGVRTNDVMQLLEGDDRAPLAVWRPPEVPEERVELEWGAGSVEALAFVLKTLCDRLAARLQGRAMAAARVELLLSLDRALCEPGMHRSVVSVVLPVPLTRAADLLAVLRTRLEGHELAAPALAVTLKATELARVTPRTLDLHDPEPLADRALPRLVAELSAELGPSKVGVLRLADTWAPDEQTELVAFPGSLSSRSPRLEYDQGGGVSESERESTGRREDGKVQGGNHSHFPDSASRLPVFCSNSHSLSVPGGVLESGVPTRLAPPCPIPRDSLCSVRPLGRVEDIEWWRRPAKRRDLVAAWTGDEHGGALAWVELEGESGATRLGWID